MIVRSLQDIAGTDRDISGKGWRSRRIILKRDGMGCSLHDTVVLQGTYYINSQLWEQAAASAI